MNFRKLGSSVRSRLLNMSYLEPARYRELCADGVLPLSGPDRLLFGPDAEATVRGYRDLITSSGSGLDPDISPAAAAFQVPRVAKARGLPPEQITALVEANTKGRLFGLLGEPRVNVLALNMALDQAAPKAP